LEVVLEGEEERPVAGQLAQRSLQLVVEVVVTSDLRQEGARAARLAQGRHPEEDLASVVVLGDRLERLEVLEPETEHLLGATTPPRRGIRGRLRCAARAPRPARRARARLRSRSRGDLPGRARG